MKNTYVKIFIVRAAVDKNWVISTSFHSLTITRSTMPHDIATEILHMIFI